jgi:HlyD family secretion protein
MDVVRTGVAEKKRRNRFIIGGAGVVVVILVSILVSGLEPAAPSVERETMWIGTVERGPMLRQVRGHGTLVPVEIRWIPAATSGRVEKINVQPGASVEPDETLIELSNPEVERSALDSVSAMRRAEAELESLRVNLLSQELNHKANAAEVESDFVQAQLRAEADRELAEKGLISAINLKISESQADSLATRREIEQQRLEMTSQANAAQIEAKRAEVEQQRALFNLRIEQQQSLQVAAGLRGVVQQIPVEVGQQVAPGTNLARVAEPSHLKAELRVPATQARDVRVGQVVVIDTRNGEVDGVVSRIDPAVREGTVTVDVEITGELPEGARPDLNVDGAIEIERLTDVLYTGRPAFGQENGTVGLFKLEEDETHAVRVSVRLGRSSVNTIEIIEGLAEGDQVVLSDTSRWDDYDRIRLK